MSVKPWALAVVLLAAVVAVGSDAQFKIARVEAMPNLPRPFNLRDWKEVSRGYTSLVFNPEASGEFLPLVWRDARGVNFGLEHWALAAYVGDRRHGNDGAQEAINVIAAVRSATLVGLDMSDWRGMDLVTMQKEFFNRANGQNLVLNHPDTTTGNSFWYEIFPSILFFILVDQYPQLAQAKRDPEDMSMREIMRTVAERWYDATYALGGKTGLPEFAWRGFDFARMRPVSGNWEEPDAAAGVAWLAYMAYTVFGDPNFLSAAEWSLAYLEDLASFDYNPLYEILLPYGAYTAARMNAELGRDYDVETFVRWCFGPAHARAGWEMIVGEWGGLRVDGLMGSLTDLGGYAFAMNTFATAEALVPIVRYDPRFARAIGKWMLHAANNARLFYSPYHPEDWQSSAFWKGDPDGVIPYEGLRKAWKGKSPYATGDAMRSGTAKTDFALYGGSHAGVFGGIVSRTNVDGILQLDLLATDYFRGTAYPTFLYYNPYSEEQVVQVEVGTFPRDLYDAVSQQFLATGVTGTAEFSVPPDGAVVLVLVPAAGTMIRDGHRLLVEGVVVDWRVLDR